MIYQLPSKWVFRSHTHEILTRIVDEHRPCVFCDLSSLQLPQKHRSHICKCVDTFGNGWTLVVLYRNMTALSYCLVLC